MGLTEGNGNDMVMPVTPMGGYGGGSGMGWGTFLCLFNSFKNNY